MLLLLYCNNDDIIAAWCASDYLLPKYLHIILLGEIMEYDSYLTYRFPILIIVVIKSIDNESQYHSNVELYQLILKFSFYINKIYG